MLQLDDDMVREFSYSNLYLGAEFSMGINITDPYMDSVLFIKR